MSKFAEIAATMIVTALDGNLSCGVYGDPPDQPQGLPSYDLPYVVVGFDQQFPFDTDDFIGEQHTIELRFFSAKTSNREVKLLQREAFDLLNRQMLPAPAGVRTVDCIFRYSVIPSPSPSGYKLGISRYRLTLMEE